MQYYFISDNKFIQISHKYYQQKERNEENLFIIILSIFFIKNLNADNKEVSDLKNEFKQIKEIYENKIEALEAKIEKLENEKVKQEAKVDHHDGHDAHAEENSFNIEAVLNGNIPPSQEVEKFRLRDLALHTKEREVGKGYKLESLS